MRVGNLFRICGLAGLVVALLLTANLVIYTHLFFSVLIAIVGTGIVTFFLVIMATKFMTGNERIIYYHHEIVVMAVVGLVLRLIHQPLLPYLDITILGIGTFLVYGRMGCFMGGCCHGRPCRWGVRYGEEHAATGFPSYLVGVRLFPIQAVESFWVLCTVAVGTFFVWTGKPAGTALAWYVVVYDAGRFCFEFARGDADRPYSLGFSQPQWISLILTVGIVGAEWAGVLPFVRWHSAAFALLAATMASVAVKRRFQTTPAFQLLHPKHIRQVASAMTAVCAVSERPLSFQERRPAVISMARTSLGIRISGSQIRRGDECVYHYTLSSERDAMTERVARILAKLIRCLNGRALSEQLIAASSGVFHVVMTAPVQAESPGAK